MQVGANDIRSEVTIDQSSPLYCRGINDSGNNRVERAKKLHDLLIEAGIRSQFDLVANADHHPADLMQAVAEYFRIALQSCSTVQRKLERL